MKRILTLDDIIDIVHKIKQRGLGFILSKINIIGLNRTKSAFGQSNYKSADWWTVPMIKERWNELITGDKNLDCYTFLIENHLNNKKNIRMISLGSGSSNHEIELAKYIIFSQIICIDISETRIREARAKAEKLNLKNIQFICANVNNYDIPEKYFDIVFFHSSLHHFNNIKAFTDRKIKKSLKSKGLLVINEYVGATRLQFPKIQISEINKALKIVPKLYRTRYKSNLLKRRYYGSGILRMIIADPTECIDSESILPVIHSNFEVVIEKPYGGNLLMNILKDISHHFIDLDSKKIKILDKLFQLEDEYLLNNKSDFIFGVYRKID